MVKAEIQSRVTGQVDVLENLGPRISRIEADVTKACPPLLCPPHAPPPPFFAPLLGSILARWLG